MRFIAIIEVAAKKIAVAKTNGDTCFIRNPFSTGNCASTDITFSEFPDNKP
jgi:hypothetical protein